MATYSMGKVKDLQQRVANAEYKIIEKVVDFSNKPYVANSTQKAWATGDVYQFIGIRPKQTVLAVDVEVLKAGTANCSIAIGYGSETGRWGVYPIDSAGQTTGIQNSGFLPKKFTASDTIDLVLGGTITSGRVKIRVYILDERGGSK